MNYKKITLSLFMLACSMPLFGMEEQEPGRAWVSAANEKTVVFEPHHIKHLVTIQDFQKEGASSEENPYGLNTLSSEAMNSIKSMLDIVEGMGDISEEDKVAQLAKYIHEHDQVETNDALLTEELHGAINFLDCQVLYRAFERAGYQMSEELPAGESRKRKRESDSEEPSKEQRIEDTIITIRTTDGKTFAMQLSLLEPVKSLYTMIQDMLKVDAENLEFDFNFNAEIFSYFKNILELLADPEIKRNLENEKDEALIKVDEELAEQLERFKPVEEPDIELSDEELAERVLRKKKSFAHLSPEIQLKEAKKLQRFLEEKRETIEVQYQQTKILQLIKEIFIQAELSLEKLNVLANAADRYDFSYLYDAIGDLILERLHENYLDASDEFVETLKDNGQVVNTMLEKILRNFQEGYLKESRSIEDLDSHQIKYLNDTIIVMRNQKEILIYDLNTKTELLRLERFDPIKFVEISPDRKKIALCFMEGCSDSIYIYDLETGCLLGTILAVAYQQINPILGIHNCKALNFSADGSYVKAIYESPSKRYEIHTCYLGADQSRSTSEHVRLKRDVDACDNYIVPANGEPRILNYIRIPCFCYIPKYSQIISTNGDEQVIQVTDLQGTLLECIDVSIEGYIKKLAAASNRETIAALISDSSLSFQPGIRVVVFDRKRGKSDKQCFIDVSQFNDTISPHYVDSFYYTPDSENLVIEYKVDYNEGEKAAVVWNLKTEKCMHFKGYERLHCASGSIVVARREGMDTIKIDYIYDKPLIHEALDALTSRQLLLLNSFASETRKVLTNQEYMMYKSLLKAIKNLVRSSIIKPKK